MTKDTTGLEYGGPAYYWRRGTEYGTACENDARELAVRAKLTWHLQALWKPARQRAKYWAGYDDTDTQVFPIDQEETDTPHSCDFCGALLVSSLTAEGRDYLREEFPAEVVAWYGLDELESENV